MPYYVVYAVDKIDAMDVRDANRIAHRARLRTPEMALTVHVGGPMTDAKNQMIGTMLVIEAASQDVVECFIAADPYSVAGLYEHVDICPFVWGLGQPEAIAHG